MAYLRYEKQQKQQAWGEINQAIKSIGDGYKEQSKAYESILQNQRQRPNTTIIYPANYKGWIPVY